MTYLTWLAGHHSPSVIDKFEFEMDNLRAQKLSSWQIRTREELAEELTFKK